MKKYLILFLSLYFTAFCNYSLAQSVPGWKLVWHDEFNGKRVDKSKWNILTRETSKHGELQFYIPDEVYIADGCLRIRSSVRDFGNKHYTSGRLDTKDKLAVTYGRFEIKGKLPVGKGL